MLTDNQIKKLQPLTKHPKYGKILIEAIKGWKYTTPRKGSLGIVPFNDSKIVRATEERKCCLLGASLIGKHHKSGSVIIDIEKRFKIEISEFDSLAIGFDNSSAAFAANKDAYDFASQVRKILRPLNN